MHWVQIAMAFEPICTPGSKIELVKDTSCFLEKYGYKGVLHASIIFLV